MKTGIRIFKEKKNIGVGEKQDQYFLSLSKVVVTNKIIVHITEEYQRWYVGLVLAYV